MEEIKVYIMPVMLEAYPNFSWFNNSRAVLIQSDNSTDSIPLLSIRIPREWGDDWTYDVTKESNAVTVTVSYEKKG